MGWTVHWRLGLQIYKVLFQSQVVGMVSAYFPRPVRPPPPGVFPLTKSPLVQLPLRSPYTSQINSTLLNNVRIRFLSPPSFRLNPSIHNF